MSAQVSTAFKIVIVGAGIGARKMVEAILKSSRGSPLRSAEITVIQPNDFAEVPFSGPLVLAYPEHHAKNVSGEGIQNVTTILGVATSTKDGVLTVSGLNGGPSQEVKFDYLIAATGFQMPTILTTPGQSFEERQTEIRDFNKAITSGGDVVIGGGGIIAVELAGNMCEIIKKNPGSGKVKLVTSGGALCPTYPVKYQQMAKEQLEKAGCEIIFNDRVQSHSEAQISGSSDKFGVTLKSGKTLEGVSVYLPSFVGKSNSDFLTSLDGPVLEPNSKKVVLDEHLRSKAYPKLFALGGCAQLLTPESFLGVPKIEEQAKTIAKNLNALISGSNQLTVHKEGLPELSNAAVIFMGHHTYASFVPEVMPCPVACICKSCGPPCNLLCPCFCCCTLMGNCDIGCCGHCCCAPEGAGVAHGLRKFSLSGIGAGALGFNGAGKAMPPQGERIVRS